MTASCGRSSCSWDERGTFAGSPPCEAIAAGVKQATLPECLALDLAGPPSPPRWTLREVR